jgi:hypothetical protein
MILNALVERLKRRAKDDFKGRHFEAALILQAVSWYLRYPLSYRDIEELFLERGFAVDHSTLNRWVLAYAPLIERRLRAFRKPHCGSVRIDETYIKVRGQWRYLYRAIDKPGSRMWRPGQSLVANLDRLETGELPEALAAIEARSAEEGSVAVVLKAIVLEAMAKVALEPTVVEPARRGRCGRKRNGGGNRDGCEPKSSDAGHEMLSWFELRSRRALPAPHTQDTRTGPQAP